MRRRASSPSAAGLSRRTFLLAATAGGIALGLATSPRAAVAAPASPTLAAPSAVTERPHRTLLGVL